MKSVATMCGVFFLGFTCLSVYAQSKPAMSMPAELAESIVKYEPADPGMSRQDPVELSPGEQRTVKLVQAADFSAGMTIAFDLRVDEAIEPGTAIMDWPGVMRLVTGRIEGVGFVSLWTELTTDFDKQRPWVGATGSAPVIRPGQWVHVTICHQPVGPLAGHLSAGTMVPRIKGGALVTMNIASIDGEPLGCYHSSFAAPGSMGVASEPLTIGSDQFDGAIANLKIKTAPTPIWWSTAETLATNPGRTVIDEEALHSELHEGQPVAMTLIPTFNNISVYALHKSAPRHVHMIRYRVQGEQAWKTAPPPMYDAVSGQSRGSILGVPADTAVEVQLYRAQTKQLNALTHTVRTWSEDVPIGEVRHLPELTEGPLEITAKGSPDAWIVYRPKPGATARIEAAKLAGQAVHIHDAAYVIFEDVTVRGGLHHGINVASSHHIRIRRCDIAEWGQKGFADESQRVGLYVDSNGRPINNENGVHVGDASSQVVVDQNLIHSPRGQANSWDHMHPRGPGGVMLANTNGNNVVRNNDIIGSEIHWWNDGIGSIRNGSVFGGPYRDTDIHGNLIAFASDDATELDGGQMNVRFYNNRLENCYVGLSATPNVRGPSFVFRNVIANLGDMRELSGNSFKFGGGYYPMLGMYYIYNNSITTPQHLALSVVNSSGAFVRTSIWRDRRASNPIIAVNNIFSTGNMGYPPRPGGYGGLFQRNAMSPFAFPFTSVQMIDPFFLTTPPDYRDAAASDLSLASDSPFVDQGVVIDGITDNYQGAGPDLGAIENDGEMLADFPVRADGMKVWPQRFDYGPGLLGQPREAIIRLHVPPSTGQTWHAIPNASWLRCEPSHGVTSDQPTDVRISLMPEAAKAHRGAITFRTDQGVNRTVLLRGDIYDPEAFTLRLEAENAQYDGDWLAKTDTDASGHGYLTTHAEEPAGRIVFEFDVPQDDTYYLRVRLRSPGPNRLEQRGIKASVNDPQTAIWETQPPVRNQWYWQNITFVRTNGVGAYELKKGRNRVIFEAMDAHVQVDALVVTVQPHKQPPPPYLSAE